MKTSIIAAVACVAMLLSFSADAGNFTSPPTKHQLLTPDPRVKFDTAWIDYNTTQTGVKGMLIHLRFTIYEMKQKDCALAIYFMDGDENPLKDKNQKFNTKGGDVAAFFDLKPGYDEAYYKDLQVFMPYDELDLGEGKYDLSMDMDINHADGNMIQHLKSIDFTFTQPAKTTDRGAPGAPATTTADAKFEKVWVDYDVTEGGKRGMRIHTKFSTSNLKDVTAYLAEYFQKTDGTIITTTNKTYASTTGQLALFRSIKPIYADAVYDDIALFLPYDEVNLPKGTKYNLQISISLIYENGGIIKHLTDHYFDFTP